MNRIHRLFAAALLGTAAVAAHAAGDWKGYAGVNCLSQDDAAPVRRSATNQTALSNMGTNTITVFCPIVRDVEAAGSGRVIAVAVRFRNRNPGVNGSCEFSSHDQSGYKVDTQTLVAPFGETTLSFAAQDAQAWGSYALSCQLPGRDPASGLQSYIVNYRVDEKP